MLKLEKYKTVNKFKVLLGEKSIGYVDYDINNDTFIIKYIQISSAFRGKGYGKAVISKLLKLPYKNFITTNIAKKNIASQKLFTSCGFNLKDNGRQLIADFKK